VAGTRAAARWAALTRRARRPGISLAAVLIGAACGGGLYAGSLGLAAALSPTPAPWGEGRVTDGSVDFSPDPVLLAVEHAIEAENLQVTTGGRYESVVLLDPFTFQPGGTISKQRMEDELIGGYLAQRAANQEPGGTGIQLLLANEGTSAQGFAGQAVQQIESVEAADRIVAVAGMGLSVASTEHAATALSADGMAMFGAVTTADQFNGNNYPGFFQVVPYVDAQVHELSGYLSGKLPSLGSGQFVALVSDAAATDIYSKNLQNDFNTAFVSQTPIQPYSFTPDASGAASQYATITRHVCGQPAVKGVKPSPIVLYAGRAAALPNLIQQFQQSATCVGETVTIVTGSDANGLPLTATAPLPPTATAPLLGQAGAKGQAGATVQVDFADIEDVSALNTDYCDGSAQYLAPRYVRSAQDGQVTRTVYGDATNDEWAIATFNAVISASNAIIRFTSAASSPSGPSAVKTGALNNAGGTSRVGDLPGATGQGAASRLSFTQGGQLESAAIPVDRFAGGRLAFLATRECQ
jgi:hypothetical protein